MVASLWCLSILYEVETCVGPALVTNRRRPYIQEEGDERRDEGGLRGREPTSGSQNMYLIRMNMYLHVQLLQYPPKLPILLTYQCCYLLVASHIELVTSPTV